MRAQFIASEVSTGLRRNLTMTFAVILTVGVSLGIAFFGLLMRSQVNLMKDYFYANYEISIFLSKDVTQEQRGAIEGELQANPEIETMLYESKQEAYQRFREQFKDSPGLVNNVTEETLPESFRVKLKNPENFDLVAGEYTGRPGVEQVGSQRELIEPVFRIIRRVQLGAGIIAGAQLVAAVLLIGNTIRLAAFSRRRETGIMRLVGASNFYIQLPFLLEGALAGALGALLGTGVLAGLKMSVIDGLRKDVTFTPFVKWWDVFWLFPWMAVAGVGISALASFVTLRKYLRV